jgi:hypothetical protein
VHRAGEGGRAARAVRISDVPQHDGPVLSGGGQRPAVGADRHRVHLVGAFHDSGVRGGEAAQQAAARLAGRRQPVGGQAELRGQGGLEPAQAGGLLGHPLRGDDVALLGGRALGLCCQHGRAAGGHQQDAQRGDQHPEPAGLATGGPLLRFPDRLAGR